MNQLGDPACTVRNFEYFFSWPEGDIQPLLRYVNTYEHHRSLLHRSPSLRDAGSQWPKRPFGLAIENSSVTTKPAAARSSTTKDVSGLSR
jgi:hypothetical protein